MDLCSTFTFILEDLLKCWNKWKISCISVDFRHNIRKQTQLLSRAVADIRCKIGAVIFKLLTKEWTK